MGERKRISIKYLQLIICHFHPSQTKEDNLSNIMKKTNLIKNNLMLCNKTIYDELKKLA